MRPNHRIAFLSLCAVAGGLVALAGYLIGTRGSPPPEVATEIPAEAPVAEPELSASGSVKPPERLVTPEALPSLAVQTAEQLCEMNPADVSSRLPTTSEIFGHQRHSEAPSGSLTSAPRDFNASNCGQIHQSVRIDLDRLLTAARADSSVGNAIVGLSCFRSVERQAALFCNSARIEQRGIAGQARWVAPPGYSEHATGLAIDFGNRSGACNLEPCFVDDPVGRWLKANAGRFGFKMSFPEGNPQGVGFEPWHFSHEGA